MNSSHYTAAGWLCFVEAVLALPMMTLEILVAVHLACLALLSVVTMSTRLGLPDGWAMVGMMAMLIPCGLCGIAIGTKMLNLPDDLLGLGKPFGVLMIAGWAMSLTWFLIPLGMLLGMASTVVLGVIFLRQARGAAPEFV